MGRIYRFLAGTAAVSLVVGSVFAGGAQAAPAEQLSCAVSSGREPERAAPEQVGLDSGLLADAVAFA
ncbi:hydrolase, partial [Nocardia sp. NPDC052112]